MEEAGDLHQNERRQIIENGRGRVAAGQ
jgi:hypothetical protein